MDTTYFDDYITEQFDNELFKKSMLAELEIMGKEFKLPSSIKDKISKLNINSLKNDYKKYTKTSLDTLKENGIDVNSLKKDASQAGKQLKSSLEKAFNKGVPPKKAAAGFNKLLTDKVSSIVKKHVIKEKGTAVHPLYGIYLFVSMFVTQLVLGVIVIVLFGPVVGNIALLVFIAPITEEAAKSFALQKGIEYGKNWTFGFAIAEMIQYLIVGSMAGVPILILFIARIMALIMHMTTANIQADFIEKDKTFTGYIIGVLLHGAWNTIPAIAQFA